MKKYISLLLAALLLLSGCSVRIDKTTAFKKYGDKEKSAQIEKLCSDFAADNGICGLSVGIMDGFEVKFFNYGKAYEQGTPVSEDTIYPINALTEMFTGVMWAEWEKREWFVPTTETSVYFPYTPMPECEGVGFNSFQLVTHTSALPPYPDNFTDPYDFTDLDMRAWLCLHSLERKPGEKYEHSPFGIGLLGYILETRLKKDFEVLVKESIMYRCSMTSTTVSLTDDQKKLYAYPNGCFTEEIKAPSSCMQGAYGFNSSTYDMLIFASLNLAKVDVSTFLERAVTLAHEKHFDDGETALGYGFFIEPYNNGTLFYNQSRQNGTAGFFGVCDSSETAVCVLCNNETDVSSLARQILSILNNTEE